MDNFNRPPAESLTLSQILDLPIHEKEWRGLLHTPQEIFQQPDTWRQTVQTVENSRDKLRSFLRKSGLSDEDNGHLSVSLIGAGTSDYIGRALAGLIKKEWRCHAEATPSTDLLTEIDAVMAAAPAGTRHLWISFSRSGDSYEGVAVIERALKDYPEISHLIVTCNENGRMARELCPGATNAFCLTLDKRVNDLGLAMTSSFTNMVITGQAIAHIGDLDNYKAIVEQLADVGSEKLSDVARLSSELASLDLTRICFLGTGILTSVGAESALKVMELTAGHFSVMSESFLGLRHGPLSWLNDLTLVVAFLSGDKAKARLEMGLIEELKAKNTAGPILLISPNEVVGSPADFQLVWNLAEPVQDSYRPPLDVLFAQCFALFSSMRCGLKPDSPSADGKIQRVVSQIGTV
ncbi:MAG TPA: SIS domain-containing protein [Pyrinomonadaceae bacterium]|nr:SIS domain-containing protein [Pyrinomonadaceae bacterium]